MKRAVDMLLSEHRVTANFSSLGLLSLLLAMLIAGIAGVMSIDAGDQVGNVVGFFLGVTLIVSLLAMILSTYYVVRGRKSLSDWGVFLAITWLLPYIGISVYLGGANLLGRD